MSNSAALNYNVVSKKLDRYFMPVFVIVGVVYGILYFALVVSYDTKGPDKDALRKKNITRAASIIVKKVEDQIKKEEIADNEAAASAAAGPAEAAAVEEKAETEAVKGQVSEGTKKAVKQSAAQKEKAAESRKARRAAAQAQRSAAAGERAAARLAKIQAKSRSAGGGGSEAYASFKSGGGGGDLASKLSSSGGIGIGGGGSGKAGGGGGGTGRAGGGSGFGGGKGSLDDFLSGGSYGDATAVEGVSDFKVTPLAVKGKGSQSSSRKTDDLQRELNQRLKTLQQCIKKGRSRNNELTGSIIVQFTIKPDGKVNRVRVSKSSWNDPATGKIVEKCILDGIEEWRFTPVEKGEITIEQPFIF